MSSVPAVAPSTGGSTWKIDSAHSNAEFAVKHMMISTVRGRFRTLEGTIHLNEAEPARSSLEAVIEAASVDTAEPKRDDHLRSADFFEVEKYPRLTFRSTRVEQVKGDRWQITGDLTIRDVTKEVVLDTEYEGQIKDAYGLQRAAFSAQTELNRKDFGLNWNALIEAGGVAVGDKIRVTLNIAAVRQDG
jgi:polyisoprenoid-binding protein YceI